MVSTLIKKTAIFSLYAAFAISKAIVDEIYIRAALRKVYSEFGLISITGSFVSVNEKDGEKLGKTGFLIILENFIVIVIRFSGAEEFSDIVNTGSMHIRTADIPIKDILALEESKTFFGSISSSVVLQVERYHLSAFNNDPEINLQTVNELRFPNANQKKIEKHLRKAGVGFMNAASDVN